MTRSIWYCPSFIAKQWHGSLHRREGKRKMTLNLNYNSKYILVQKKITEYNAVQIWLQYYYSYSTKLRIIL